MSPSPIPPSPLPTHSLTIAGDVLVLLKNMTNGFGQHVLAIGIKPTRAAFLRAFSQEGRVMSNKTYELAFSPRLAPQLGLVESFDWTYEEASHG